MRLRDWLGMAFALAAPVICLGARLCLGSMFRFNVSGLAGLGVRCRRASLESAWMWSRPLMTAKATCRLCLRQFVSTV